MKLMTMRSRFQEMKVIPPETEQFSRYRTALENSLARAVKALRQSQLIRQVAIEGSATLVAS